MQQEDKKPTKKQDTYSNKSNCVQYVFSNRVQPGGDYALTNDDKKDEAGMSRLATAVKHGLMVKA